jgi:hypothetical protein
MHDGMSTGTAKPVAIGPRFVPVEVVDAFSSATSSAAGGTDARGAASLHVDVLLPGGVTVRVEGQVDEAVLRSIFRAIVAETHEC